MLKKADIKKLLLTALSPQELRDLWHSTLPNETGINVIDYDDIINCKNINGLFRNDNKLIIFYPNHRGEVLYGHYCALIMGRNDTVYFFDSYGGRPDVDQKRYSGTQRKDLYKEEENSLINLLLESGYDVDYSHHKLQSLTNNSATCGRWCLTRCALKNLTNDEFAQVIKSLSKLKNISPDEVVVQTFH
nr:PRO [Cafeteriavirus-dependent mavirus]|tara:strand:+ start:56 stop:622 length:567 start_codon:yes stop_codon:yes gene_type:complete